MDKLASKLSSYNYINLYLSETKMNKIMKTIDLIANDEYRITKKYCFSLFYIALVKNEIPFIDLQLLKIFKIVKKDLKDCYIIINELLMESVLIITPWKYISLVNYFYDIDIDKEEATGKIKRYLRKYPLLLDINPYHCCVFILSKKYDLNHELPRYVLEKINKIIKKTQ